METEDHLHNVLNTKCESKAESKMIKKATTKIQALEKDVLYWQNKVFYTYL